jgi:DNA-binding GntR family transcriptional regulator
LAARGAKKALQRNAAKEFRALRSATKGAAFGNRKLLKKLDQNFHKTLAVKSSLNFNLQAVTKELSFIQTAPF